jgi:hypothetical protein
MRKIVISALIAGAAVVATPAAAQNWGYQGHGYGNNGAQIGQQINQLHNQIAQAQRRGTISPREANGLRRQATQVQRNYRLFGRNGLDRREVAQLQRQVQQVRQALRFERRDSDRRRG